MTAAATTTTTPDDDPRDLPQRLCELAMRGDRSHGSVTVASASLRAWSAAVAALLKRQMGQRSVVDLQQSAAWDTARSICAEAAAKGDTESPAYAAAAAILAELATSVAPKEPIA